MRIKSISKFRQWVKEKYGSNDDRLDHNFMGIEDNTSEKKIRGFYRMFHGINRNSLEHALFGSLQLAEDTQGIYEFIQNSADCESSYFALFYDKRYFLAFNNGKKFSNSNVVAILNEGDSDKTDGSSIGRFGVGFKIVHRLVGETDGLKELVDENAPKGPVIFSWNNSSDIKNLLNITSKNELTEDEEDTNQENSSPWLFKILLTNFPTAPTDKEYRLVKGLETAQSKPNGFYPWDEFNNFTKFLEKCTKKFTIPQNGKEIKLTEVPEGSLFFIDLGERKSEKLDEDIQKLKHGVQFSLNFLGDNEQQDENKRKLKIINLNGLPLKTYPLKKENIFISHRNPLFKELVFGNSTKAIKITFAYQEYQEAVKEDSAYFDLRKKPNFFKFFPMEKETIGLNFVLHSDAFIIEKSRRELQQDDPRNVKIFEYLIKHLTIRLDLFKKTKVNFNNYLDIYTSILTSKEPREVHEWIKIKLYAPLFNYIETNIPTVHFTKPDYPIGRRIKSVSKFIKIKQTLLEVEPSDLGLKDIEWFHWHDKSFDALTSDAALKLKIDRWNILDLLIYSINLGYLDKVNLWIKNLSEDNYDQLLTEIDHNSIISSNVFDISEVELFKCSDNNFYSYEDFLNTEKQVVFLFEQIEGIKNILLELGLNLTLFNISNFPTIYDGLKLDVKYLGDYHADFYLNYIETKFPNDILTAQDRIKLFEALSSLKHTQEIIQETKMFYNSNKKIRALNKLLPISFENELIPDWLNEYKIHTDFKNLNLSYYLISDEEIYEKVCRKYWDEIIENINTEIVLDVYKYIRSKYKKEEHKELAQKSIFIYTEAGFQPKEEIFYHPKVSEAAEVLKKITNKYFPIPSIMLFLEDENSPFYISPDNLSEQNIASKTIMSFEEASQLVNFSIAADQPLFKFGYFEKDFTFIKDNEQKQYFLSGSTYSNELRNIFDNYVNEYFADSFKPLNKDLFFGREISKLARKESPIPTIVDKYLSFDELKAFQEFLPILLGGVGQTIQNRYLQKIKRLDLDIGENYSKESYEYQVIELYIRNYKEREIELFRRKIFINGTPLLSIEYKLEIKITTPKNREIRIAYDKILPNDADRNSNLIEEITKQFNGEGFDKIFKKQGVQNDSILKKLKKGYKNLENLDQLAFVLFYVPQELSYFNYKQFSTEKIIDFFYQCKYEVSNHLKDMIKFNAKPYIYPSEFALTKETLPVNITNWINQDNAKIQFVSQLGVHINTTHIFQLRKFLLEGGDFQKANIAVENLSNQVFMLKNTIYWLAKEKRTFSESDDKNKISILKKIYQKILLVDPQLPIPLISLVNDKNECRYILKLRSNPKSLYLYSNQNKDIFQNLYKIFEIATKQGNKILDLSFFNQSWKTNFGKNYIQLKTEKDEEELHQINTELQENYYQEWKKENTSWKFFKTAYIPYKDTFLNEKVRVTPSSKIYNTFLRVGNKIYIKPGVNVINVLERLSLDKIAKELKGYQAFIALREKLDKVQYSNVTVPNMDLDLFKKLLKYVENQQFERNDTRLNIIKDIYTVANIRDTSNPLVLIDNISLGGKITYKVAKKKTTIFGGIHHFPISQQTKILGTIKKHGHSLLAEKFMPNIIYTQILGLVKDRIDTTKATIWTADHYQKWSKKFNNKYIIDIIDGPIPFVKQFLGERISGVVYKGNAAQDSLSKKIYINKNTDIEKQLEIAQLIDFDPYILELIRLKGVSKTISIEMAELLNAYGITSMSQLKRLLDNTKPKSKPTKSPTNTLRINIPINKKLVTIFSRKKFVKSTILNGYVENVINNIRNIINLNIFKGKVNHQKNSTIELTKDDWKHINDAKTNYYIAYELEDGTIEQLKITKEKI